MLSDSTSSIIMWCNVKHTISRNVALPYTRFSLALGAKEIRRTGWSYTCFIPITVDIRWKNCIFKNIISCCPIMQFFFVKIIPWIYKTRKITYFFFFLIVGPKMYIVEENVFSGWKHHLYPLGLGGDVKKWYNHSRVFSIVCTTDPNRCEWFQTA